MLTLTKILEEISNQNVNGHIDITIITAQNVYSISFTDSLVIVYLVDWFAQAVCLLCLLPNSDPDLLTVGWFLSSELNTIDVALNF